MPQSLRPLLLLCLVALLGCGSSEDNNPSDQPGAKQPGFRGEALRFEAGPFEVKPGEEVEMCISQGLEEDAYINHIESHGTLGLHHLAVIATPIQVPKGVFPCREVLTEEVMGYSQTYFATTRADHVVEFPKGVAAKLSATWTNLIISVHALNLSDKTIEVGGNVTLGLAKPSEISNTVNGALAVSKGFSLPPHSRTVVRGKCTTQTEMDVVAIGSHAHGRLLKEEIWLIRDGVRKDSPDNVNYDWATPFVDIFPNTPIHLKKGDSVEWACHYQNTTNQSIVEGPSAQDEMCKAVLVYMPNQGMLRCTTTPEQPESILE